MLVNLASWLYFAQKPKRYSLTEEGLPLATFGRHKVFAMYVIGTGAAKSWKAYLQILELRLYH